MLNTTAVRVTFGSQIGGTQWQWRNARLHQGGFEEDVARRRRRDAAEEGEDATHSAGISAPGTCNFSASNAHSSLVSVCSTQQFWNAFDSSDVNVLSCEGEKRRTTLTSTSSQSTSWGRVQRPPPQPETAGSSAN